MDGLAPRARRYIHMTAESPLAYHEPTGFSRRALEEYRRVARCVVLFDLNLFWGFERPTARWALCSSYLSLSSTGQCLSV